jgi:hypothetical protein
MGAKQADYANDNEINCDDEIQHAWHNQYQYASDKCG